MPLNPLKYLDRRIPRYTSYPTAPQFGSDVDAGSYERWLTDLSPKAPVSIYLLPFFGVIISALTLKERITRTMMLGGLVTLAGAILITSLDPSSS